MTTKTFIELVVSHLGKAKRSAASLAKELNHGRSWIINHLNGVTLWKPTVEEIEIICDFLKLDSRAKQELLVAAGIKFSADDTRAIFDRNSGDSFSLPENLNRLLEWKNIHLTTQAMFVPLLRVKDAVLEFESNPSELNRKRLLDLWEYTCNEKSSTLLNQIESLSFISREEILVEVRFYMTSNRFIYGHLADFSMGSDKAIYKIGACINDFWTLVERLLWVANKHVINIAESIRDSLAKEGK